MARRSTRSTVNASPPLVALGERESWPLSYGQQRLWVIEELTTGPAVYNVTAALRLRGPLDREALTASLATLVQRHAMLRTRIERRPEGPVQVVVPDATLPLREVDLRGLAEGARETAAAAVVAAEAEQRFDLGVAPLGRVCLIALGDDDQGLVVTLHHMASDGWSTAVLLRELSALYTAGVRGEAAPVWPPLPLQYGDYACWQRAWEGSGAWAQQLAYWATQLAGLPVLTLPTDRPRPAHQTFAGARQTRLVPAAVRARLEALGRTTGTTRFMTTLATFQLLLARLAGSTDIAVGVPIAGREQAALEGLIGFFVNTLVLRTDLAGDPAFATLVARVRQTALAAYAHQAVPFEQVVERLQPARDLSHHPLFQVMFTYEPAPAGSPTLGDVTVSAWTAPPVVAKFDLNATVREEDAHWALTLEYNTDLFDADTIMRWLGHWETVLSAVAADPMQPLSRVPLLTPAETAQIVETWNATARAVPELAAHLDDLVAAQAARTPDAVAVIDDTQRLTYRALHRAAARLAARLRAEGVPAGACVGVWLPRSVATVVAQLGILYADAAFVPLDVHGPPGRAATMLRAVQAQALVTTGADWPLLAPAAATVPSLRAVLCLDRDDPPTDAPQLPRVVGLAGPTRAQPRDRPPAGLAYVIFTSGSTGAPKGVAVDHAAVINLLDWATRAWHVGPDDRVLLTAAFGFDLAVYDVFGLLAVGGTIRIAATTAVTDPTRLRTLLATEPITIWDSTPSVLQALLPWLPTPSPAYPLRLVLFSGDWIPVALPAQVRAACPRVTVMALGGATEATVWSNHYAGPLPAPGWSGTPYGQPIQNAQYYVLDRALTPCPIGVPGDLYIGGTCLAVGYAGAPELTALKFVPHPVTAAPPARAASQPAPPRHAGKPPSAASGARLYRTGDRARWHADGLLEFLGRSDHQVKLRGFRIEPGEVEAALRAQPGVAAATVLVRRDGEGPPRLVGYVVPHPGDTLSLQALRRALSDHVPDYMVPSALLRLDALPLTPNGKIDRQALPAPHDDLISAPPHVAPRTPLEHRLATLWARLLQHPDVGIHDNFFDLGGDSIMAMQIAMQARSSGLALTVQQIFRHQTIADLAAEIARASEISTPPNAPDALASALPTSTSTPYPSERPERTVPLTPIQRWFFEQELPEPWHFNQSVLLRVPAGVTADIVEASLNTLALHHDAFRLQFARRDDGAWDQTLVMPDRLPRIELTRIDVRNPRPESFNADTQTLLITEATRVQRSLTLAAAPLLRAAWFTLDDHEQRLLLVMHHLIVDGVSWRILLNDLEALCEHVPARASHDVSPAPSKQLPPQTSTYADWAAALNIYAASEQAERDWTYWAALSGLSPLPFPQDAAEGPNTMADAAIARALLSPDDTADLQRDVPKAHRTDVQATLVTALARTLARWSGHPDVLLDLESHGRDASLDGLDPSRTVGWFTTIYPFHARVSAGTLSAEKLSAHTRSALSAETGPAATVTAAESLRADLRAITQQLRAVPSNGLAYMARRYPAADTAANAATVATSPQPTGAPTDLPPRQVLFNYLGDLDRVLPGAPLPAAVRPGAPVSGAPEAWRAATEPRGHERSLTARRTHVFVVTAFIQRGALHLDWEYTRALHCPETIQALADRCLDDLRELIAQPRTQPAGYTIADFPLATISEAELARLTGRRESAHRE